MENLNQNDSSPIEDTIEDPIEELSAPGEEQWDDRRRKRIIYIGLVVMLAAIIGITLFFRAL